MRLGRISKFISTNGLKAMTDIELQRLSRIILRDIEPTHQKIGVIF